MIPISEMVLPSVEEVFRTRDPIPRDEKAETKLQREVPWLLGYDTLSLVLAKEAGDLERFLYYLIATIGTSRPIRLFLRVKSRNDVLSGIMRSFVGASYECPRDEMEVLYQKAKERLLLLDLKVDNSRFGAIEDFMEYHPPAMEEMSGSVVIFDSLVSLTTKATTKWALSRAIIGARLKEWMEFSECSVILFDRLVSDFEPGELEDGIYDYLDGSLVIHAGKRHNINGNVYHERDIRYKYKSVVSMFKLYMDWQQGRFIDELPEEESVEELPSEDGMPF